MEDFYPGKLGSDAHYKDTIERSLTFYKEETEVSHFKISGISTGFVKVKSQINSAEYPTVGYMLVDVYNAGLVSTPLGFFDSNDSFHSIIDAGLKMDIQKGITENFPDKTKVLSTLSWNEFQQLFSDSVVLFSSPYYSQGKDVSNYKYLSLDRFDGIDVISPEMATIREALGLYELKMHTVAVNKYNEEVAGRDQVNSTSAMITEMRARLQDSGSISFLANYNFIRFAPFK